MNDKKQTEQAANEQIVQGNPDKKSPDNIQWHAGFCSAMQLELKAQWPVLTFTREYSLTKKPLAVDLLVVRKTPEVIADELEENDIDKIRKLIDEISKENASSSSASAETTKKSL